MQYDRCGNRIAVSKHDIELLQRKKLLLGAGNEEIANIWKELSDRCPLINSPSDSSTKKALTEETFIFSETLKHNTNPTYDIAAIGLLSKW